MKTPQEIFDNMLEKTGDKKEYEAFLKKLLKKYKVKGIEDLKGANKKKFFDELDSGWKGDNESD